MLIVWKNFDRKVSGGYLEYGAVSSRLRGGRGVNRGEILGRVARLYSWMFKYPLDSMIVLGYTTFLSNDIYNLIEMLSYVWPIMRNCRAVCCNVIFGQTRF